MNWKEEYRDEYGDLIGGPKISKKKLKKNLASNEKDEKITRSESTKVQEHNDGSAKNCKKGEYFCKDDHKCKPIPKGYHVMPDGMLMKGKKHSVNEIAMTHPKKKKNPFGKRAVLKMLIKSVAEKERSKAGVTREDYLSELKKKTLGSYVRKSSADMAGAAIDNDMKKVGKRYSGIQKATKKLEEDLTSYKDFMKNAQAARERVKRKQTDKKKKDAQYSDMKKHGIKFFDKKGSGRMVGGKKKYD